ncbi:transcriptional regulator [Methanofollis aquaemaris]|uniref:Transcriptional regulator n=1 Tax=Methanofollis aquaemaris TaxID=126734 RepID=A0A8A3S5J2_9EURY|nr:helix-turn-helix transcriptional regulator [Methanofollis aquaemaris]QSZ67405.1 transcriptional regulator [Methanofollis aquaemaris]
MHQTSLPPSSRKVLLILEDGGAMTHKDLVRNSSLAPRTVRYALKRLKENNLIIEKFNFKDARQIIYECRPQEVAEAI